MIGPLARPLRRRRLFLALATAVTTVVALTGCGDRGGGPSAAPGEPAKVRVLLDWFPNPDHVGLYTAQQAGLFEAADLSVTLTPPSNPGDVLKLVASRQVELGISYEPEVLMSAESDLPLTAVAAVFPVALNSLMAVGDSPVRKASDLEGRTVGTAGLPSDDVYLKQIARTHDVDLDTVRKVNVSSNLVAAMVTGKVDATIGAYRNIEGVQLAEDGHDPTVIPVTEGGVPEYDELVVVANRDRLADDAGYRDLVTRFVAALGQGVERAQADPTAASAALREVADGYRATTIDRMVEATLPLLDNPRGFGRMDVEEWQSFADWLHREGMVNTEIDVGPLVTNDYVPGG